MPEIKPRPSLSPAMTKAVADLEKNQAAASAVSGELLKGITDGDITRQDVAAMGQVLAVLTAELGTQKPDGTKGGQGFLEIQALYNATRDGFDDQQFESMMKNIKQNQEKLEQSGNLFASPEGQKMFNELATEIKKTSKNE